MSVDLLKLIADVGGSLGLALFAVWMMERTYREQRRQMEEERAETLAALERNTTAWQAATESLTRISTVMLFLARNGCGEEGGEG